MNRRGWAMKSSIVLSGAVVMLLAWPLAATAQSEHGLTRAEVVQELIQVEQAGYRPGWGDNTNYPDNIQAALARIAAQRGAAAAGAGGGPSAGAAAPVARP
ncbi:DUF4148 domain-containing protein [Paraburkholderia sp. 2C]